MVDQKKLLSLRTPAAGAAKVGGIEPPNAPVAREIEPPTKPATAG